MEYTDFCIAPKQQRFAPLTVDAIYYVTADSRYHIYHSALAEGMIFAATLRGSGEIRLNEKNLPLNAGDILVFSPREVFEYRCVGSNWSFWWFEFRCAEADFLTLPPETVLPLPLNDTMLYLCRESLESLKLKDTQTASVLLSSLLRLLQKERGKTVQPEGALALFHLADQYIHQNLAAATVQSTARHLNVSERTLLNVFRSLLDISTLDYIRNMKMDMAHHLLTTGASPIGEIASLLGYTDQFAFSKSFVRHFGVSPSEYRRRRGIPVPGAKKSSAGAGTHPLQKGD